MSFFFKIRDKGDGSIFFHRSLPGVKGQSMIALFLGLAIDMAYGPPAWRLTFTEIHIIGYPVAVYCLIDPLAKPYPLPFGIGPEGLKVGPPCNASSTTSSIPLE
jgi:hypothetical protein